MKIMVTIFGTLISFIAGAFLTKEILGGAIAGVVGGIIFNRLSGNFGNKVAEKIVNEEAKAISGPKRHTGKAIFWWFIFFIIAVAAIIVIGLQSR